MSWNSHGAARLERFSKRAALFVVGGDCSQKDLCVKLRSLFLSCPADRPSLSLPASRQAQSTFPHFETSRFIHKLHLYPRPA